MVNPYTVLNVQSDASIEEIRQSYRALAFQYHPDKAGPAGTEKFKEINAAYQILSDPRRRETYDKYGSLGDNLSETAGRSGPKGLAILLLFLLICSLVLIFTAFLVSYCDGKLGGSWNFVKVFSPLFALDALLFFVLLGLFDHLSPAFLCTTCFILCAIILTILIPIGKDKNDTRSSDFILWRLWLIPGYVGALSLFVALFLNRFVETAALVNPFAVSILIFQTIGSLGIPLFVALVACRADEVINCSFFIVIALPIYLWTGFEMVANLIQVWFTTCHVPSGMKYLKKMLFDFFWKNCWKFFIIISASLVSKRLDYFNSYQTYEGTYLLATCLIPLFIILGFVELVLLLLMLVLFCCNPLKFKEKEDNATETEDVVESSNENIPQPKDQAPPLQEEPARETTSPPVHGVSGVD